VKVAYK